MSTTLKSVSTLFVSERGAVTKGSIELRAQRIDELAPGDLVAMGMVQVMEGRHCFGHLSVEDSLITGASNVALKYADYGYILESGRVVMDGPAKVPAENKDVKDS